jgi:hypothetical protein
MAGAYIILIRELCTELVRLFSLPGENPGDDIHIVSLLLAAVQERCYHKVISPNEDDIISKNIKYICRGSANTIFKWEWSGVDLKKKKKKKKWQCWSKNRGIKGRFHTRWKAADNLSIEEKNRKKFGSTRRRDPACCR